MTGFTLAITGPLVMLGGLGVGLPASGDDDAFDNPESVALVGSLKLGGAVMMLLGLRYARRRRSPRRRERPGHH